MRLSLAMLLRARLLNVLPFTALGCALLCAPALARAQSSSSSSSSSSSEGSRPSSTEADRSPARPPVARVEPGGAAVTLEYSEPLFQMASALNACGYDNDLDHSSKVRHDVRDELNAAFAASEPARTGRDALCAYLGQHRLADPAANIGQYISLALYLAPPPALTPSVDETELPPQAAQVVNVLPLVRSFAEATQLHLLWVRHRPEYEALAERVHDPMSQMILRTNIYLHQPVSSYDGRRFLVLLEPMLSPALTNARIYGSDYIIVVSPDDRTTGDPVRMDEIRHIYLHYVVEPMVYSRGSAMQRIQPLLRGVADAPIDFIYKSDVEALLTECLIKAIEAHMYTVPEPPLARPKNKSRTEVDAYEEAKAAYDRENAAAQALIVARDDRAGWVLTGYFYKGLSGMEHNGDGLRDEIAPMIYGMDVDGQRRYAESIPFVADPNAIDPLRPNRVSQPKQLAGMDLAEAALMKGDTSTAADLAGKAMTDPAGDHGRAQYVLARIDLMEGDPEKAMTGFTETLKLSHDPRTVAWSHIYLGRLYDNMSPPDRKQAVSQYQAALEARDSRPDTRAAAESGLKQPFALPRRAAPKADDADFDPTGKAQKEAWKPRPPQ